MAAQGGGERKGRGCAVNAVARRSWRGTSEWPGGKVSRLTDLYKRRFKRGVHAIPEFGFGGEYSEKQPQIPHSVRDDNFVYLDSGAGFRMTALFT